MRNKQVLNVFVLLVFGFIGMTATAGLAQDKLTQLRYTTVFNSAHENFKIANAWCDEVEKRTNGKIKVRQYATGVVTPPGQIYDSVVQGVVDVGNMVLGYTMGRFPLTEVLDYPLGYPSGAVATRLANAYYGKFKPKEFDELKVMYLHAQTPGILHTRKPVNKMEDLKGMKIRTSGSNAKFISLLGGIPVAMPMPEAYDALSKGVADGLLVAYEALEGWKLGEVIQYTTEDYDTSYTAVFAIVMNKNKWNSIPPDVQKIIEQINQEWIEKQGKVWDAADASGKAFSLKRGNKIIKLSEEENKRWVAKAQPLFDDYAKNMKAKGLPGEEVLQFAQDYLKANRK
jgi:TRAP-type transport system periplasmic protein